MTSIAELKLPKSKESGDKEGMGRKILGHVTDQ